MYDYRKQAEWNLIAGKNQSPISINTDDLNYKNKKTPIEFISNYRLTDEINDQTTIRLLGTGQLKQNNQIYKFQQVHFHYPAEHVIDGKKFDFEIHLVHQSAQGDNLVIGLMVEIGDYSDVFQRILDNFSSLQTNKVDISINDWIPKKTKSLHYIGSLTTPPLTEEIDWYLFSEQVYSISKEQFLNYKRLFLPNSRDLQAINDRRIDVYD